MLELQVLLPPRLPSTAHSVAEGEQGPVTPPAVRALAFVTLGGFLVFRRIYLRYTRYAEGDNSMYKGPLLVEILMYTVCNG